MCLVNVQIGQDTIMYPYETILIIMLSKVSGLP
ncbi:hypothetical protein IMSAGC011_00643 [Lachnospiraceae bacterium]|nr:hypothetical protein IMSAGC011_00643 [Lachnospiraceae bacterium]